MLPAQEQVGASTAGASAHAPRVGVLVVAYNAASTLVQTLSRLPQSFTETVDHVMICDDASPDDTYEVGVAYQGSSTMPISVVKHEKNLGYGGNQKAGYRWAIDHGLDIVVLLHGDGQYAPEHIEEVVAPLLAGEADAVFGSRMMHRGEALKGGMPLYKYVGNKILTTMQNRLTGLRLSEWHSGYRAYRVDTLAELDVDKYSDDFDFDTEIILGLHKLGKRIVEVPIPTFYGDEICYVNGMRYAKDVTVDVVKHWADQRGFGGGVSTNETETYALKTVHGSHAVLLNWLAQRSPSRVLDAGCFDGRFADLARRQGHHVTGIDRVKHEGVGDRLDEFVEADLNEPLPTTLDHAYDVVVAGDILEHVVEPHQLLTDLATKVAPGGELMISVPNFSHWYPRFRVLLGKFDYDQRGLLDRGHLRFFTRDSLEELIDSCGLSIIEHQTVSTPFESLLDGVAPGARKGLQTTVLRSDQALTRMWPRMFGYQFLYRLAVR